MKLPSETTAGGVLLKKVFLKISQNSQEDTGARVSFLIKLQAAPVTYWKKDSGTGVFLWISQNFLKHLFLEKTSGGCFWYASELTIMFTAWKVSKTKFFMVRIFPHSDWIRRYGEIQSISQYSVRTRKNADLEKFRIWTLFTQCFILSTKFSSASTNEKIL